MSPRAKRPAARVARHLARAVRDAVYRVDTEIDAARSAGYPEHNGSARVFDAVDRLRETVDAVIAAAPARCPVALTLLCVQGSYPRREIRDAVDADTYRGIVGHVMFGG